MTFIFLAAWLAGVEDIVTRPAPVTPRGHRIAKAGGIRASKTRDYRKPYYSGHLDNTRPAYFTKVARERNLEPLWILTDEAIDMLVDEALSASFEDHESKAYSLHGSYETWA